MVYDVFVAVETERVVCCCYENHVLAGVFRTIASVLHTYSQDCVCSAAV